MRKSVNQLFILLVLLTGQLSSSGQDFLPTLNDNYMGINQAFLQPASIVDSRFRSDWNAGGFSNDIYNDALRFRSRWVLDPTGIVTNDDWWDENTYLDDPDNKDKNLFMSQSLLGPGFLANINRKHAIGFTSRVRSITNSDDLDEPLFRMIYSDYGSGEQEYWNKWYYDEEVRAVQHVFGDYGLTYAGVIFDKRAHFLKAGGTLKLLQGIAASYLQTNQLYYYYDGTEPTSAKPISWNSPYVYGGLSDNWGDIDENGNYTFSMNYQLTAKPSVGLDLGVVYEFRPKWMHEVNPKDGLPRADHNKYLVKVGISLLDLGRLKYKKDYYSTDLITSFTPDYAARYNSGDNSIPTDTYWLDADQINFTFRNYVNFADTMYRRYKTGQGVYKAADNNEEFKVRLPAAFSLQADVHLYKGLYVNLTTYTGLHQGFSTTPNSHYVSNYSITPRYEEKWYSVSVPVQVNQYGKFEVGLGARVGVVYFGVNNLFSNVFSDPYGIHGYIGAKVPIPEKDPTKPPKVKGKKGKSIEIIINYCPCCGCQHNAEHCFECRKVRCTDTNSISKMDCIPGCVQIILTNPTITINPQEPASPSTNTPDEGQNPTETEPEESETGPVKPPTPRAPTVHFNTASSAISTEDRATLDAFVNDLLNDPDHKLRITGHTDNIGSSESNMLLSKKRAEAVYNYLLQRGVSSDQLELRYNGEENPLYDNTTPEGRWMNRRTEVEIIR